jgi:hypothetical protein
MKKITILCFSLISSLCFSQKVDLDRFYFDVNYQKLPNYVVPLEQRTYSTRINTDGPIFQQFENANVLNNQLYLDGWRKNSDNGNVNIDVNLADFYEEAYTVTSRTVEEKDKDGKVIRSYPMFILVSNYRGNGYATIVSSVVLPKQETTVVPVTETPKTTNRFMKNVSQEAAPATAESNGKQDKLTLSGTFSYNSSESTSRSFLENEYEKTRRANYNTRLRIYINSCIQNTNSYVNKMYGFSPIAFKEQLWIMDSKEEEGAIQKEAIEAVKSQFALMKHDEPIDKLATDLKPLIEYFESLKTKYPDDNKGSRKIRYSAYYNLGKIYIYLDQPEKAIKEGEGLVANDYDKKDGKNLIEMGNDLLTVFKKSGLNTRHNPALK